MIQSAVKGPFYGREDVAKLCQRSLLSWFAIPGSTFVQGADAAHRADTLVRFIAYLIYRTWTPDFIVFGTLYLLEHLKSCVAGARASNGQRLFTTALILSWKMISDFIYSNRTWATFFKGVFDLDIINKMEREMCMVLGWRLHIELAALSPFEARLRDTFRDPDSTVTDLRPSSESLPESQCPDSARASALCMSSSSPVPAPSRASPRTSGQAPADPPSSTVCTGPRPSDSPEPGDLATHSLHPPCSVLTSGSRLLKSPNGPPVSSGNSPSHSSLAPVPNSSVLSSADSVSSPSLAVNALTPSLGQPQCLVDVRGCCVSKAGSPTLVSDPEHVPHDRVIGRLRPAVW